MRAVLRALIGAGMVLGAAQPGNAAEPSPPAPAVPVGAAKTVALTRLVVKLQPGVQWLVIQRGMFCATASSQTWAGGENDMKVAPFMDTFREEFKKSNLSPEPEASLFDPTAVSPSEFALAGVVSDEKINACAPDGSPTGLNKLKGEASLAIDWQLYSRLEKQVVARVHTTGSFSTKDIITDGAPGMLNRAMAENFRQLAADPAFRKALSGTALAPGALVAPPVQTPQVVGGALAARPRSLDKAGESVVVIYSGNSLGSGFLISREGYVLTDAHVVGDAANVRLRWSDGTDTTGAVVRTSKERDVALIKTDAKSHEPLPLSSTVPEVGATVFAIGAPDGQKFEGTVTRGVISASRVFDGFNYIQSDVTTGHGASGGPLLDESGRVVGLTEGGLHQQTSSGINVFTPIKDAVAFLALDLR